MISLRQTFGALVAATAMTFGSVATAVTISATGPNPEPWTATITGGTDAETVTAVYTLDLTSVNVAQTEYTFSIEVDYQSSSGARLVSWGFDTNPDTTAFNITSTTDVTNTWATTLTSSSIENCAFSGSTCNGGQGGGLSAPSTETFNFTITFASAQATFDLGQAFGRFQSVDCGPDDAVNNPNACAVGEGDNDGSLKLYGDFVPNIEGCPPGFIVDPVTGACVRDSTPEVPLPAGLPLMLSAIGIGAYMRKRSRKTA